MTKSISLWSMSYSNRQKPLIIVGLGKSGHAALNYLIASGASKDDIITFDEKDSSATYSSWAKLLEAVSNMKGTLVVSPGVPLLSPGIQSLRQSGWIVSSEISLACEQLKDEVLVGITGSVGKSTVTSLLGVAALSVDENAFVGGNLGTPFCDYALRVQQGGKRAKYVVLELSSYQLENCKNLSLNFSALTYLAPNHLERYESLDAYYQTKCLIGDITKHVCVLNGRCKEVLKYQSKIKCPTILANDQPTKISLIGEHNVENYLVAETLCDQLKFGAPAKAAMQQFQGLPHRLETIGVFNEIIFINDSKATAMDSVLVATRGALERLKKGRTLYLLLGGKDKNLPWENLNILKNNSSLRFVFFGACGELARTKSQLPGDFFAQLKLACEFIFNKANANDIVLLSPGGTSLDEFRNFEDRGDHFKKYVVSFYSKK
jgi:UDP-N-acetylmuramoylalanine--D-glutamate ligase